MKRWYVRVKAIESCWILDDWIRLCVTRLTICECEVYDS